MSSLEAYSGGIDPKGGWGGYPTPSDPGITPPTIWEVGRSTLAAFEGFSSSENKREDQHGGIK